MAAIPTLAVLVGCLPATIHPLYTEEDLVFDPALVGVWRQEPNAEESMTFTKADDRSYKLLLVQDGQTWPFEARLVKLGGHRFLDLFPHDGPLNANAIKGPYRVALARCHLFLRVDQIGPELQLVSMNLKWLQSLLQQDPKAISHAIPEPDHIVLTAPTKELRAFLLKHIQTEEAWGNTAVYRRMPQVTEPKAEQAN